MSKNPNHRNLLIGAAGVYAVAEQMCVNGISPLFPGVDLGIDLVAPGGIRIQVKTACLRKHRQFPGGVYTFQHHTTETWKRGKLFKRRKLADYAGICDVIVFACLNERRFFIVPAIEVEGSFWIEPRNHDALKLKLGMRQYNRTAPSNKSKVLSYEGAWHLLDVDSTIENLEAAVIEAEGASL